MPELFDILAKAELKLTNNTDITVPTGAWVAIPFNEAAFSRGAAITPDTSQNAVVINEDGYYGVSIMVNAAFDRTEEIRLTFEINGTAETVYLSEQGRGANKPIDFSWYGIRQFTSGDVIKAIVSMEATETEVSVLSANMIVAKES